MADKIRRRQTAHSLHRVRWRSIINRCYNPGHAQYADYGGRGIAVCDRWRVYENFLADMGYPPTNRHSLDRFPDNNGNYEPGNCRWATSKQQANNRRTAKPYMLRIPGCESQLITKREKVHG